MVDKWFNYMPLPESTDAADYMRDAIFLINAEFGEGYAQRHPELVGGFMQASALKNLAGILETIPRAIMHSREQDEDEDA